MKHLFLLIFTMVLFISCSNDDNNQEEENQNTISCDGDSCAPQLGSDELVATLPSSTAGEYNCVYTFAEDNSPFTNGTLASFKVEGQTLIVDIDGFECITLTNPVWRFGVVDDTSGNYTFKDNCRDNIAYNLSYDQTVAFNEVNIEVVDGPGFYGQFTLQ